MSPLRVDGAGNLTRFDKWNASANQVDTVRYGINGANPIACIDADESGECDGSEFEWVYDIYGNLKSDGTNTYAYDAANRLNAVGETTYTSYDYNGDGDRISQTVGTVTTTYILDTATPLTMVLAETTGGVTTRYWHGLDTLAQSDGTTTQYFAYDGLGSVRQLVDTSGFVALAQTFDPYGNGYAKFHPRSAPIPPNRDRRGVVVSLSRAARQQESGHTPMHRECFAGFPVRIHLNSSKDPIGFLTGVDRFPYWSRVVSSKDFNHFQ